MRFTVNLGNEAHILEWGRREEREETSNLMISNEFQVMFGDYIVVFVN